MWAVLMGFAPLIVAAGFVVVYWLTPVPGDDGGHSSEYDEARARVLGHPQP